MTAVRPTTGLVAVVDALGTADYSVQRVDAYLAALEELLEETMRFADDYAPRLFAAYTPGDLERFVFQDSVILAHECPTRQVGLNEILWFGHVLRTFLGGAFHRKIFFRGAWAIGEFYLVDREKNRILGPAVRDAALWYEASNWIGIHATPRTSLHVQALADQWPQSIDYVLLDYPVPMKVKADTQLTLKAVNWPKHLHLRYGSDTSKAIRSTLGSNLAADAIPVGAEQKHFHTRSFFDYVVHEQHLEESWHTRRTDPNARHPANQL